MHFLLLIVLFTILNSGCFCLSQHTQQKQHTHTNSNTVVDISTTLNTQRMKNSRHLIVLANGILGSSGDLTYLAERLRQRGYFVLQSKANELHNSLFGIAAGGEKLKEEVMEAKAKHGNLEKISFIGNSLGGLFVRYAAYLLFDHHNHHNNTIIGLTPHLFMTIATPHLGVRRHTFFEDYNLPKPPDLLRDVVSSVLLQSGKDLFGLDQRSFNQSLVYQLATEPRFLKPLQSFSRLRLYANVHLDFMVPLGTAAILPNSAVEEIRQKHQDKTGIVDIISSSSPSFSHTRHLSPAFRKLQQPFEFVDQTCSDDEKEELAYQQMITALNSLNWEKVMVRFSGTVPNAHNKICAMKKFGKLIDRALGYDEGEFVIDHVVEWIDSIEEVKDEERQQLSS